MVFPLTFMDFHWISLVFIARCTEAATAYTASELLREERLLWRSLGGFSMVSSLPLGTMQEDVVVKVGDEEAFNGFHKGVLKVK